MKQIYLQILFYVAKIRTFSRFRNTFSRFSLYISRIIDLYQLQSAVNDTIKI